MPFIIHALLPFEQHICLTRQKNRGIISFNTKRSKRSPSMRCAARLCVLIEENRMEAANKIAIITDTCCDLPQEYLKEYSLFINNTTFLTGVCVYQVNAEFYAECPL